MFFFLLNFLLAFMFLVFAYLNLNDDDALLWVSIYLAAAIICGFAAFKLYNTIIYSLVGTFDLLYAVVIFVKKDGVIDWVVKYRRASLVATMQATKPYIEQTREFFGLLIVISALVINYVNLY